MSQHKGYNYNFTSSDCDSDSSYSDYKRYKKKKRKKTIVSNWSFEPVYISAFGKEAQILNINDPIAYETIQSIRNGSIDLDMGQITVDYGGVYKYHGLFNTSEPCQVTLFINGSPLPSSTSGTNTGAAQITMGQIIELNAGDIVEVRNFTSAVNGGVINIPIGVGGIVAGTTVNAEFNIWKIAEQPILCPYKTMVGRVNKYNSHKYIDDPCWKECPSDNNCEPRGNIKKKKLKKKIKYNTHNTLLLKEIIE